MSGFTGEELHVVEQGLQKIKAIAELMTMHEWEPAFSLSPQSFTEIGHILGGYAKEALAVFGPPAPGPLCKITPDDDERPDCGLCQDKIGLCPL